MYQAWVGKKYRWARNETETQIRYRKIKRAYAKILRDNTHEILRHFIPEL